MTWDGIIHDSVNLLAVLVLVLLNAFFVAAELAFVRIRDTQLDALVAKGNRRAKMARHISGHIDAYIGATQFGITLASLGLGVVIEPVFRDLLDPLFQLLAISSDHVQRIIAIGVGFFVNCYLLIVVGELVPKAIAIRRTLQTSLWVAGPLDWFYRISFPFIWLLHHSSQFVVQRLGISAEALRSAHSEEELRLMFRSGQGTAGGRSLILNALDLPHRIAREVMRPRHEIAAFNTDADLAECLALAEKTRYSRFPLCAGGDLDRTRGVVHIKDLYPAVRDAKARTAADLLPAAHPLIYVPETAHLEKLLQLFLDRKLHVAIVVDEYGGTVGMVTLENVLESLVGQIQDEFDQEKSELTTLGENVWEAAGTLPVHELEKIIGEMPSEEAATVSGWMTRKLGGFPKVGDVLTLNAGELRVEEMDGPRVARLKITKRVESAPVDSP